MAVARSSSREYNSPERRSQCVMLKAPVVILTRGADNKTMFEEDTNYHREHTWRDDRVPSEV